MAKADQKGRSPTSRFTRLDHRLLTTPAYRALSPNARSLLVELAMMENGKNNGRSEEHTSELQSLMRISYAVFCLKKKKKHIAIQYQDHQQSHITTQKSTYKH